MNELIYKEGELDKASAYILDNSKFEVICLIGNLGAGKTSLVKSLLKQLGSNDHGDSPTFGIVNEYSDKDNNPLAFHLDCYRINSIEEALDIGLNEYLESDRYVFIEWSDRIAELLPIARTEIQIDIINPTKRRLTIKNLI